MESAWYRSAGCYSPCPRLAVYTWPQATLCPKLALPDPKPMRCSTWGAPRGAKPSFHAKDPEGMGVHINDQPAARACATVSWHQPEIPEAIRPMMGRRGRAHARDNDTGGRQ